MVSRELALLGLLLGACAPPGRPPERGEAPPAAPAKAGLQWLPYESAAPCRPFELAKPWLVIGAESEYRAHFCGSSSIDWRRFRLVVYSEVRPLRRLEVDELVRDGASLVLVLRRGSCRALDYSYQVESVAALVSAGSIPVRVFVTDGSEACEEHQP